MMVLRITCSTLAAVPCFSLVWWTMRQCSRNVWFHTDVTPSLLPACLTMATGPCNTLAVNKCPTTVDVLSITLLQDGYPSFLITSYTKMCNLGENKESLLASSEGKQRRLQFQMEGCKQKKKPTRGTARGKEKGIWKMMNAVGEEKEHQRERQGP